MYKADVSNIGIYFSCLLIGISKEPWQRRSEIKQKADNNLVFVQI